MEAAIGPRPMADARVGQKTGITRRWDSQKTGIARGWDCSLSRNLLRKPVRTFRIALEPGTPPSAPKDQRTASADIFGAICPAQGKVAGKAAGRVMPQCNTAAMAAHLAEISRHVACGAHAVLILDQAGWHASAALTVPANTTVLPLPPKCPAPDQLRGEPG